MHSHGLQRRFAILIIAVSAVVSLLALVVWRLAASSIIEQLGKGYALRTVTWQTERTEALIDREVTLARKLADSPLLREWCVDETDPGLRRRALSELNSYRNVFRGKSCFLAIDRSRHYYFNDAANHYGGRELRYTLSPSQTTDRWYFDTMRKVGGFALNVDRSERLNTTRVWVNVVMKDGRTPLGMAGTGIDLTKSVESLVKTVDSSTETILFDSRGAITAHRDLRYVTRNADHQGLRLTTIYDLLETDRDRNRLRALVQYVGQHPGRQRACTLSMGQRQYLAAVAYMPSIGWYDLVLVKTDALLSSRQFLPILGVMACAMLGLLISVALLVQRLVLAPLARLTDSTHRIAHGQYDVQLPETRTDEIGQLTSAFNRMTSTVKAYTGDLESLVSERTQELSEANALLSESNKQIMDSIAYATVIQRGVLPPGELLETHLAEHFVIWLPRDTVGGDAYFAYEIDGGLVVAVVDCTGHGVPGALMTMSASALLLNHVSNRAYRGDPASILRAVDRSIQTMLGQDSRNESVPTGMEMGLCYVLPDEQRLVFAGSRISLWHSDVDGLSEIRGDKHSLGYGDPAPDDAFTNHVLSTAGGARFYMATDGWLDQSGTNSGGRGFGRAAFRRMLESGARLPLQEQSALYADALQRLRGDSPQRDDITLIGFVPK